MPSPEPQNARAPYAFWESKTRKWWWNDNKPNGYVSGPFETQKEAEAHGSK